VKTGGPGQQDVDGIAGMGRGIGILHWGKMAVSQRFGLALQGQPLHTEWLLAQIWAWLTDVKAGDYVEETSHKANKERHWT
jgi:hypothetical protein